MEKIAKVPPAGLRQVLAYVLADPAGTKPAEPAQVRAYVEYLLTCRLPWEAFQLRRGERLTGVLFTLLPAGATAVTMLPTPGRQGILADDQRRVLAAGLEHLRPRRLHYVQALVEPGLAAKRELLAQAGFARLTTLVYLERDLAPPPPPATPPGQAAWVPFSARTRAQFADTLLQTYRGSLDCPELAGLRPVEDILEAHRATSADGTRLWEIVRLGGRCAGCLLLSTLAGGATAEIVYMGVVPQFRRQGVGRLLLRRAVQRARARGAGRLLVVVDERNAPARRLYERFGFRPLAQREALLYRWRQPGARA